MSLSKMKNYLESNKRFTPNNFSFHLTTWILNKVLYMKTLYWEMCPHKDCFEQKRQIEFSGITKYVTVNLSFRIETICATLKFVLTTSLNIVSVPTECVTL